jgi:hypothetical protein
MGIRRNYFLLEEPKGYSDTEDTRGKRQEKDFVALSPQPVYKKGSAFFPYSILVILIGDSWLDASDR